MDENMVRQAVVLGAREGNIGGAIAERLDSGERGTWRVALDDCWRDGGYAAPFPSELERYDACVVTLGTTHMQPFKTLGSKQLAEVLYGSLELPLEAARSYVQAREGVGPDRWAQGHNGTIVFIGSYAHDHPFTHCTSYCVAKAGLDMACRSLAWELMPDYRVHIVHPHHVEGTPMTEKVWQGMQDGMGVDRAGALAYSRKDLRMPDPLAPLDVAEVVSWLLNDQAAQWTSGTGINMYGGVR